MFTAKALRDEIIFRLSLIETCLKWHTQRNHTDNCREVEAVAARFLASICGWNLEVLEKLKKNYPAADLGDFAARVAIQVTVNKTTSKIKDVHAKAIAHKLGEDFDQLIILFLTEETPTTPPPSKTFVPCTSPRIECWGRAQLNAKLDDLNGQQLSQALEVLKEELFSISSILSPSLSPRPANLPYSSMGSLLKGRGQFLSDLRTSLAGEGDSNPKVKLIYGMGGVGKTRVAVEYAWRNAHEYSALLFVSADSPEAFHASLAGLCASRVLDLPEQHEADENVREGAVLKWLELHQGWLLVIDNADSRDSIALVQSYLPVFASGHVLITSRMDLRLGTLECINLNVLNLEASTEFLAEWTRKHRASAPDDDAALQELASSLDGLALALQQAAAYICEFRLSFREYLDHWKEHTAAALEWHDKDVMQYPVSLAITYETSLAHLDSDAVALFYVLAWFDPEPIPMSILGAKGLDVSAKPSVAKLLNLSLAQKTDSEPSFTIHRVLQEITRQKQLRTGELDGLRTALDWISELVEGYVSDVRSWEQMSPLMPHAHRIGLFADEHDIGDRTAGVLSQVALFYKAKARFEAARPLYPMIIANYEKAGETRSERFAMSLNNYGQYLEETSNSREAERYMTRALNILKSLSPPPLESIAIVSSNLGNLFMASRRGREAEKAHRKAIKIFEELEGPDGEQVAIALSNLGVVLTERGEYPEAELVLQRALAIDEKACGSDHPNFATRLSNLANVFVKLSRMEEAESLLVRALDIVERKLGENHPRVATRLANLASVLAMSNKNEEAEKLARRAIKIDEEVLPAPHINTATDTISLGFILHEWGRYEEARSVYERGIDIMIALVPNNKGVLPFLGGALEKYSKVLLECGLPEEQAMQVFAKLMEKIQRARE
jgi:tetratricopeptide (TPR) repeat protein